MIESILIRNWKGHKTFGCKFEKGLNFIIGPNGVGKSSILEALYYGITGFVKSRASLEKMKTIDSEGPMIIEINLSKNDAKFKIVRKYEKKRTTHTFYNLTENYSITGKDNVEKAIRELYITKNVFLKKMFYYGEGDIFRVISSTKSKFNFKDYIEEYLGIEKLKEFQENIRGLKSNYNKKRKEFDYEVDQMISLTTEKAISAEKKHLIKRKEDLKDRRKTVEKHLDELKREYSILEQKINHIDDLEKNTREFLNLDLFNSNILNIVERLKEEIHTDKEELKKVNSEIDQESEKLEKIEEKVNFLRNIVNLLKDIKEDERSNCPVCDRLFDDVSSHSAFEKLKLYEEIRKSNDQTKSNLEKLHYNYQNSKQILEKKIWLSDEINKISSEWENAYHNYREMKQKSSEIDSQIKKNTSELNELKIKIEEITTKQLKLATIQKKKENEKEMDESYIQSKRKRLNNSIFLSEILENVIDNTLYEIKLEYLYPLTQKISDIWKMIFNDKDRYVSFDQNLNPILKTEGQEIGFNNLSGGEKTILTIITKSLLMHQFSNIDFIVLDEPLEHLDIINRFQIIEFLVMFYKADLINQLIITTFEESLTRNLIDNDDVSIISLGSLLKYPEILEEEE